MSAKKEIWTVGELARKSSLDRMAVAAATADDRALEILVTPGAAQKKITPLSEESTTVNPCLLVVGKDVDGTMGNGVVRVRPAWFEGGVAGDAYTIGIAAKLKAALDSAAFAANPTGATRYDLLYITISFGLQTTESVRQKPLGGGDPLTQTLTTQSDLAIAATIVQNVAQLTPLASLPADPGDGSAYNFGVAMVALPAAFAGAAINQAAITQLWTRAGVKLHRLSHFLPSLFTGTDPEKPTTLLSTRCGRNNRLMFPVNARVTTGAGGSTGAILDNTIDWRHRIIVGKIILSATLSPESVGVPPAIPTANVGAERLYLSGSGSAGAPNGPSLNYNTGAATVTLCVDTAGALRLAFTGTLIDAVNGDPLIVQIEYGDQLVF